MRDYQRDFIEFAIAHECLKFGDFTLKSGRKSPFFFNAGLFNSGAALARLGEFYAKALMDAFPDAQCDSTLLFGPAYKGIPLVTATSMQMSILAGADMPFAYNRKEAKQHGEGGQVVGASVEGPTIIIDDVITAGTAIKETMQLLSQFPECKPIGVLVALDRQERGSGDTKSSAIQLVQETYGVRVQSIVSLDDVVEYLQGRPELQADFERLRVYRQQYGVDRT